MLFHEDMNSMINKGLKKEDLVETPRRILGARADFAEGILSRALGNRYIEYRKRWVDASRRRILTDFPLYIQIEHIGKCNLRCPTCVQGIPEIREKYSAGFNILDIRLYEKILDEAKRHNCPSISFHNNDEPLLLNDLERRIELAVEYGFLDIILTTNANLLYKKMTKMLLKSGVTKINFSIDAVNKEDYENRRVGGDFKSVIENIDYFIKEKKRRKLKLPITRVTCVLSKFSVKDTERFRDFWVGKVDMVEFQNFQAIKGYTEELRPEGAVVDTDFTCNGPWQQVVIRANGDVLPCCSFYGTEMVVGSVNESSIYDIWHGGSMKKIREELAKGNFSFSSACKKCSETFYIL